ncbi:NTP transferase domain-containing protein [Zavarzinia sp. CC-PAN008]|uniref:phosphocholine cytidylyltransferase family protein n=1 Tax=Zavarzinia sp. CC-PAN008 TaxID=3243332 RepID=UPI003F743DD1
MTVSPSRAPRAIILAAGVGRRLGDDDAGPRPKALLDFGGRSLLARHLDMLHAAGVEDVHVVVGFEAEQIHAALAAAQGPRTGTRLNPHFREGSVVSLSAAHDIMTSGAPIILMDADVLYDARLLGRLFNSGNPNSLLLDRDIEPGEEPVKLCIEGADRIVDFRKKPDFPGDWHGESVGFFRFTADVAADLAERVADYVANGRRHMEYEEPIRDLLLASAPGRIGFEDITGLPWVEIDFPEDVAKAHALLPRLVA